MALLSPEERDDLVNRIAQAVIDRIDQRDQVNRLSDLVIERVLALQEDAPLQENTAPRSESSITEQQGHANAAELIPKA